MSWTIPAVTLYIDSFTICQLVGTIVILYILKLTQKTKTTDTINKNNEELVKEKFKPKKESGKIVIISNCSNGLQIVIR